MRSSRQQHWLRQFLLYLIISAILFVYLFPLLWQLSTSLKQSAEVFAGYNLFPKKVVWDSYGTAWSTFNIRQYLFNTVVVAGIVTLGTLFSCAMAGYSFARLRFPGRDFIFYFYLGTMMVPGAVTLIPAYYVVLKLNLSNSFFALIIPFIFGNAFGTFLMRQYYLTIPRDLAESATIDGAGYLRTWWSIMLPLSKPTLATLGVMTLVSQWNSFIWPLVVTQNPALKVLAVGLSDFRLYRNIQWNALMAAVMIAIIPMLIILTLAQKLFIKGIQFSGVNR